MSASRLKVVRISALVLLALLLIQFEFGMAVNISNPPSLSAFNISNNDAFNAALKAAGGLAEAHAILGFMIWLIALANSVLCLRTGIRSAQVFGILTLLGVTLAGIGGAMFVSSGFNNDSASHSMATNFVLSYSFAFLEFYALKGHSDREATRA